MKQAGPLTCPSCGYSGGPIKPVAQEWGQPAFPADGGYQAAPRGPPHNLPTNGMALTGFILSLVSWCLVWIPYLNFFSAVTWILAIIFSAVGLSKTKQNPHTMKGRGLAIAGLIISLAGIVVFLLLLLFFAALFVGLANSIDEYCDDNPNDPDCQDFAFADSQEMFKVDYQVGARPVGYGGLLLGHVN